MIAGITPNQLKALSSLFVAAGVGQTVVNIARGQEIGGIGGVVRGLTGFNQKQLSASALENGNIVYGDVAEEFGSYLQNGMKLACVAACPMTALPLALWEGAEIVDEIARPDSYTTLGRAKDLLVDVPLSIATTIGIGAIAFKSGNLSSLKNLFGALVKNAPKMTGVDRMAKLTLNKRASYRSLMTWSRRAKQQGLNPKAARKIANKIARRKVEFRNIAKEYTSVKTNLLQGWGQWFDKFIVPNVNIAKSGMKPAAITARSQAVSTLAVAA